MGSTPGCSEMIKYPTEHCAILEPPNLSAGLSEMHKILLSREIFLNFLFYREQGSQNLVLCPTGPFTILGRSGIRTFIFGDVVDDRHLPYFILNILIQDPGQTFSQSYNLRKKCRSTFPTKNVQLADRSI